MIRVLAFLQKQMLYPVNWIELIICLRICDATPLTTSHRCSTIFSSTRASRKLAGRQYNRFGSLRASSWARGAVVVGGGISGYRVWGFCKKFNLAPEGFSLYFRKPEWIPIMLSKDGGIVLSESISLPRLWPWFESQTRCHVWVEFVVGSRPCSKGSFSGFLGCPPHTKTKVLV